MKSINRLLLFFLMAGPSVAAQAYDNAIKKAEYLVKAHRSLTQIPGCQIAVMVNGRLVWSQGFGYSDLAAQSKVSSKTKFRIASVSKPVTSMALGYLLDQRKIDINRDVRSYVPTFPKKSHTITPKHLASSTSGIRHYNTKDIQFNSKNYPTVLSALERFENDPLAFEPGTQYLYSSFGWVLLSAAMEKASETSFFELMQHTWDALGMENTSFDYPDRILTNKSKFYNYDKKQKRKPATDQNRSFMYAGGGYLSTAEDLVKMGKALIENTYLSKETKNLLINPQQLADGTSTAYGLGWETGSSRLNTKVVYHSGSLPTSVAHLIIYPDEEVVLAYLANTGDHVFFNAREAQTIAELFIKAKQIPNKDTNVLEGNWKIKTTSLRDKKSIGILELRLNTEGIVSGTIKFKRSNKIISCPIIVTNVDHTKVHCVGVSPMFIDFYLKVGDNQFTGEWLHDFNVKGIPEKDVYWKPRKIIGSKI